MSDTASESASVGARRVLVLRIYLPRGSTRAGATIWDRLFPRSLAYDLVERALSAGISFATVTLGHAGFLPGAREFVADLPDVPKAALPTCVELVGSEEILDAFVDAHVDDLAEAVMLRLVGADVSLHKVTA